MSKMGYSQPFKMVGKVASENKNQSKSSIMMHAAGHDGPGKGKKEKENKDSANTLPSYDTTTYEASASASGNSSSSKSSSSSQNNSTDNLANYKSKLVNLGPDYKPTAKETAAANAEVARLKALDQANAAKNASNTSSNSSQSGQSTRETTNTTTTTIGNRTLNQIQTGGNIEAQNRLNQANAERHAARNRAVSDSTEVANKYLNSLNPSQQLSAKFQSYAQTKGNKAAISRLMKGGVYNYREATEMVKRGENYLGQE